MAVESSAIALPRRSRGHDHIIDRLFEERAPRLAAMPIWPLLRPMIYRMLDYDRACSMADSIASLPGVEALDFISRLLDLKVAATGVERIPRSGRLVVICNHPTGVADGIAVWDVLEKVRPDTLFYANADAHRVAPRFDEVLIPVEWVEEKRTREGARATLRRTREAMETERPLVIFPAGRIARRGGDGRLADPAWAPSAFSVARKYDAPILPVHVAGPWSSLFHLFNGFSTELRDITLFHELLNKRGRRFQLAFGELWPPEKLPSDAGLAAARMKALIEVEMPRSMGTGR